jgi:ubiquinone/menaquinone biosynthesis C-methylase UbiE
VVERQRSAIRGAVVFDALQAVLQARRGVVGPDRPLHVVDLGGGTGGLAVRIARLGHEVVVVDPSPDALASLESRAAESGVTDSVRGVLGDAATLLETVGERSADVVICHGVLEVVDEPAEALQAAAAVLVAHGCLSVLAAQRSAAVFARAIAGHLGDARAALTDPDGTWGSTDPVPRRFSRQQLTSLLGEAGLTVAETRGIRVFTDHISGALDDTEPGAADALLDLEAAVATDPDFMAIATQLHLLATRS